MLGGSAMPEDECRGDGRSAPEAGGTEQRGGDTHVIRRMQLGGEGNQEMGGGCLANGVLVACVSAKLDNKMWRKDKNRERVGKEKK